jgi:hypothetical protein
MNFQLKQFVFLCFVAMATEVELKPIAILSINFEMVDDASSYQER